MKRAATKYLSALIAGASCVAAVPSEALTDQGITYSLLETPTGSPQLELFTLNITGINGPSDTEGGRFGVRSFAFSNPTGFIGAGPPSAFNFMPGGLSSSGCDGKGNFFCFAANSTPSGPTPLAANSSLMFDFAVNAKNLAGWDPDFKINWVGTQNNYDLVSMPLLAPTEAPPPTAVPEVEPAGAMGALTLLAGALAVLRGRRNKT